VGSLTNDVPGGTGAGRSLWPTLFRREEVWVDGKEQGTRREGSASIAPSRSRIKSSHGKKLPHRMDPSHI
jgi:hypothetical protein